MPTRRGSVVGPIRRRCRPRPGSTSPRINPNKLNTRVPLDLTDTGRSGSSNRRLLLTGRPPRAVGGPGPRPEHGVDFVLARDGRAGAVHAAQVTGSPLRPQGSLPRSLRDGLRPPLTPETSATLTVPGIGQARGPARHGARREPHHHSQQPHTTSPTAIPSTPRTRSPRRSALSPPSHPTRTHYIVRRSFTTTTATTPRSAHWATAGSKCSGTACTAGCATTRPCTPRTAITPWLPARGRPDHTPAFLDSCHPCRSEEASMWSARRPPARVSGPAARTNDIDTDERRQIIPQRGRPTTNHQQGVDKRCLIRPVCRYSRQLRRQTEH